MTAPGECCVLIPYYEAGERRVAAAVHSLLPLPPGVDVLVVDDGSTEQPAQSVIAQSPTLAAVARLRVISLARNMGIEHALNFGLEHIYGRYEFVARLDCGDTSSADRLEKQRAVMLERPSLVVVGSWVEFVDPAGRSLYVLRQPVDDRSIRTTMRVNAAFTHPAVMLRTSVVAEAGGYPVDRHAAEDFALFWAVLELGEGHNIPEVLTRCQISAHGISNLRRKRQIRSRITVLVEHFEWSPVAVYGVARAVLQLATPRSATVAGRRLISRGHS